MKICLVGLENLRHSGQFGQRRRLHLLHHIAAMNLYGDHLDAEFGGDLLVLLAGTCQGHDLHLAGRKAIVTRR